MGALNSSNDFLNEMSRMIELEYDIHIDKLKEVESEKYLAHAGRKKLLVERVENSETHLIYIYGIYEQIKSRGFNNIIRIHKTSAGKFYMCMAKEMYTVSDYIDNKKHVFCFWKDKWEITKLLAEFHKAAEGYSPPSGGKSKSDWGKWIEKYKKQCKELEKYIDYIRNKDEKSNFEQLCSNSSKLYLERMQNAIYILKKNGYLDIVEESMRKRQICMGSFKRSSIYRDKSGIYIKSLNKCKYDIAEKDISELLKKLIQYRKVKHVGKVVELIELYNKESALSVNSIEVIKAFILFPDEYEKICSRYYKSKNKRTEEIYVKKLKKAMELEDKKIKLIEALDSMHL